MDTIPVEDPALLMACWQVLRHRTDDAALDERIALVDTLILPTGRLLVTDLNFVEDNTPFRRTAPPGRYPVFEYVTAELTAAAILIQPNSEPARWVVADSFGDSSSELAKPNGLWGVSVDSAAIFVDAIVCTKQSVFNPWPIINQTTKSVVVDSATGANAVAVNLGGVGLFKAYWGLDDHSQPVALIILSGK